MYPREITTTPIWIRHKLPLCAPPPPNGDEALRNQIRFQNVQCSEEVIEYYVRQERARLDLKWCLDQFFGWNVSHPSLGQLVTANIFGTVHMAYIIGFEQANVVVSPADMSGNSVVIGHEDIYSAEDSPFYEKFLRNHSLLHSQHVLDYIANQKRKNALTEFRHDVSFSSALQESIGEYFDIEWPEGKETWLIHDELPQRDQFLTFSFDIIFITFLLITMIFGNLVPCLIINHHKKSLHLINHIGFHNKNHFEWFRTLAVP
ncbi:unnamed protein product [Rotaria sordida]|uniref:Uncharacterized protein n=1 Tax=Rotaria sordida TaxID=392033 RepID=A0A815Q0G3_9BILA|nr:unnamed protein product [Rotaria sordida]CAF3811223.1 unnamed protein product [Rotaria sordida]CAF3933436.1 unnamed protein product [Rotaria sordida]